MNYIECILNSIIFCKLIRIHITRIPVVLQQACNSTVACRELARVRFYEDIELQKKNNLYNFKSVIDINYKTSRLKSISIS